MKKLSLLFVTLAISLAAVFGTVFTACDGSQDNKQDTPQGNTQGNTQDTTQGDTQNAQKVSYSVTVLGEDEITGVSDVTVKWSQNGAEKANAVTNSDGKTSVELPAATYEVTLSNLPEGLDYTPATVTSTARGITIVLEKAKIDYTVSVKKFDNSPAAGVTVTWTAGDKITTAKTDANGTASKSLEYGNYSVTLSDLPFNNIYVGSKQVTGTQPNTDFTLEQGETTDYTITLKSEGQLLFKDYTVTVFSDSAAVASAKTDDKGKVTFALPKGYGYNAYVQNVPDGYDYDSPALTEQNTSIDLILRSEVISTTPAANTSYVIGDIIHDYEFTTPYNVNGNPVTYSIKDILNEKKAIVLNFWGTNCSACMQELPAMQQAYENYKDKVEFLAVSNYQMSYGEGDSDSLVAAFHEDNGYSFPMFRDKHALYVKFDLMYWPTNVIIDRYGAIARIEDGALTSTSYWEKLLDTYVADDYTQTFTPGEKRAESTVTEMAKPDVTVEANHYEKVAAAINNASQIPAGCSVSWFGEPEATAEYTWPFILGKAPNGDDTVLYPSNTEHDGTFSFIYATITMTEGKVFAFDFWAQTETDNDIFYVLFDGKVVYAISGENSGWQTCYVYADIVNDTHQLALSYIKDESRAYGFDNVFIKNARFTELDAITESTDMLRGAAYGTPESGDTSYLYYADVTLKNDGYYYVDLSKLQGSQYAGDDPSPMLFANFTDATNWSSLSIQQYLNETDEDTGEYKYDCTFTYNGKLDDWRDLLTGYVTLAGNSDIKGYIPVDESLQQLLAAFTSHISKGNNENEWLELCYFFSHYGDGTLIGNPIIGLTDKTAITIAEGTHTADLTRNMQPFPIIRYAFTPDKSGVFTIQSLISKNQTGKETQVWIYTDDIDNAFYHSGSDRIFRDEENEQNFVAKLYLTKNTKYYIAVAFADSAATGELKFDISYTGESVQIFEPCTSGDYTFDDDGKIQLRYAVKYEKDEDGYYHALNSDGTRGDFIYLDFKHTTLGNIYYPLSTIINQYVTDPYTGEKLFEVFDFTKALTYRGTLEEATYTGIINPALLDSEHASDYLNYTETMKKLCEKAMENDGLLKVNDDIVKILTIYHYLRTDSIMNNEIPEKITDEWLRFCWYYKTVDEKNPV